MAPGEEDALSRLFYMVYGYDYINEFVYYPEKIKAMIDSGELHSIVAVRPNGRLVGHVGLTRRKREPPVYEAGMGAVDPMLKSRGLFGRLFSKTMEDIRRQSTSVIVRVTCSISTKRGFCLGLCSLKNNFYY